jgi:hypothetical protein
MEPLLKFELLEGKQGYQQVKGLVALAVLVQLLSLWQVSIDQEAESLGTDSKPSFPSSDTENGLL